MLSPLLGLCRREGMHEGLFGIFIMDVSVIGCIWMVICGLGNDDTILISIFFAIVSTLIFLCLLGLLFTWIDDCSLFFYLSFCLYYIPKNTIITNRIDFVSLFHPFFFLQDGVFDTCHLFSIFSNPLLFKHLLYLFQNLWVSVLFSITFFIIFFITFFITFFIIFFIIFFVEFIDWFLVIFMAVLWWMSFMRVSFMVSFMVSVMVSVMV